MPKDSAQLIVDHIYGTWGPQSSWKQPPFISRAEGVYLYERDGSRYLDFSSQLVCTNLGHGNKAIIDAIIAQAQELPYVGPAFACEAKARAADALLDVLPEGLDKVFFSTSGTEANEAAVKLLRRYAAPKYKILSRYRSYHGSTAASISLTGDYRRSFAEAGKTTLPGVIFAPDAYCYRCPFGLDYPGCSLQCAEYVKYMIQEEGNVAAIFVEPVVGSNGEIVPPPEYYPRLRQICDENGVLLVADEVMTGWYRTGPTWAMDNWAVKPDILTTAKGCTGAYIPAGITATTREIADFFEDTSIGHGHTYAMHPLVLAAIPATLQEYKRILTTGLPQRVSEHIEKRLRELMDRHASVGDVRGLGHFWAVELVKNRKTKEPFGTRETKLAGIPTMLDKLAVESRKRGLHTLFWYSHIAVAPPLVITEEEVDEGIATLDAVLKLADEAVES